MGWASYMEDIIKRFEYTSRRIDTSLTQSDSATTTDYAKMRAELCTLRHDVEVSLKAFQKQLELITDPTFDAYEEWQASEVEIRKLKAENSTLQAKLEQKEVEFNKQISDLEFQYRIKIGTLEAKLKNERREAEQSMKSAKLRK
jgi:hypothetical protein